MMIFLLKFVFILIEQSVQIISADCFISGFTASQSTLFCEAKYSVLHFAQYSKFCSQSFSLRYALKNTLKNTFSTCIRLHFLPPSFCFTIRFCSYESTKDKLSLYHIWTLVRLFAGVFRKSFLPLTIIGKSQAVCWGFSRKFYKNFSAIIGFLQMGT